MRGKYQLPGNAGSEGTRVRGEGQISPLRSASFETEASEGPSYGVHSHRGQSDSLKMKNSYGPTSNGRLKSWAWTRSRFSTRLTRTVGLSSTFAEDSVML